MFSQFFGQFLLNSGYLKREELLGVLKETSGARVRLGTLAISNRLITTEQVEEIHNIQAKEDKRFGQIAIEKGYLTADQLDDLLAGQNSEHNQMMQVLLDKKLFNLEELDQIMENYRVSNALNHESIEALKNNEVDTYVDLFLDLHSAFDKNTCKDYAALFLKSFIRFVDRDIRFDNIHTDEDYHSVYLTTQVLEGKNRLLTGIGGSGEVFLELASRFSQETKDEIEDIMEDAVGEFLNLQNGLFAVNMSNKGIELDLEPQIFLTNALLCGSQKYWILPVITNWGKVDLVLGQLEGGENL